ncbi:MAG: hypothetical protein AB7T20_09685 [Steroidobacteraceae bacterium]
MTGRFSTIAKRIANGLAYSARTTAMHEGLPWDADGRPVRGSPARGQDIKGGSGGVAGKRPRHE